MKSLKTVGGGFPDPVELSPRGASRWGRDGDSPADKNCWKFEKGEKTSTDEVR